MKKIQLFILFMCLFLCTSTFAQRPLIITEDPNVASYFCTKLRLPAGSLTNNDNRYFTLDISDIDSSGWNYDPNNDWITTLYNVGINTTTPEGLLEIQGSEGNDSKIYLDADDGDDATDTWILDANSSDNHFSIRNDATSEGLFIDSNGCTTIYSHWADEYDDDTPTLTMRAYYPAIRFDPYTGRSYSKCGFIMYDAMSGGDGDDVFGITRGKTYDTANHRMLELTGDEDTYLDIYGQYPSSGANSGAAIITLKPNRGLDSNKNWQFYADANASPAQLTIQTETDPNSLLQLYGSFSASVNVSGATYASDGSVSDAELKYNNTLTSNTQDQINLKAPVASPTFTTQITSPIVYGSSAENGDITIEGTSSATKTTSYVILQPTGGYVGIGTTGPGQLLHVLGNGAAIRVDDSRAIGSNPNAKMEYVLSGLTSTPRFEWQHLTTDGTTGTERLRLNFIGPSTVTDIMVISTAGNVGINTTTPTSILETAFLGTAKSVKTGLELTNTGYAADMDGTEGRILMNLFEATTPAKVPMAEIRYGCEQDLTSTLASQDGYVSIWTALDGVMGEKVRVTSTGNVGIKTTTPDTSLAISGLTASTGTALVIDANNNVYTLTSSLRYKENVEDLKIRTEQLNKVMNLVPKSFNYKATHEPDIGYIAEDFEELGLTDLLIYDAEGLPNAIKYDRISLYLVEIIKRQQGQLNRQQKQINDQNERMNELEKKLNMLEMTHSSGNVGFIDSSPESKLHIVGTIIH